jgi:hypothetical protein
MSYYVDQQNVAGDEYPMERVLTLRLIMPIGGFVAAERTMKEAIDQLESDGRQHLTN